MSPPPPPDDGAPRNEAPRGALARRVSGLTEAMASAPPGEQALVAAGLFVFERLVGFVDRMETRMETLVEEQRASARRSREILEMFPPLLGKLGDLLDLEIANARKRLRDRAQDD